MTRYEQVMLLGWLLRRLPAAALNQKGGDNMGGDGNMSQALQADQSDAQLAEKVRKVAENLTKEIGDDPIDMACRLQALGLAIIGLVHAITDEALPGGGEMSIRFGDLKHREKEIGSWEVVVRKTEVCDTCGESKAVCDCEFEEEG